MIEQMVYDKLMQLWKRRKDFVRVNVLANMLHYSPRWTRELLVRLEKLGLVKRKGQRGGWMPCLDNDVRLHDLQAAV